METPLQYNGRGTKIVTFNVRKHSCPDRTVDSGCWHSDWDAITHIHTRQLPPPLLGDNPDVARPLHFGSLGLTRSRISRDGGGEARHGSDLTFVRLTSASQKWNNANYEREHWLEATSVVKYSMMRAMHVGGLRESDNST